MKYTELFVCFIIAWFAWGTVYGATPKMEVVVYTSVDQVFSEPILKDFEQTSGIKVRAVYDTEAAKTTGIVNRLIAEKDNPQADVFWNGEISRTIVLKKKGVLTSYTSPSAEKIPVNFKDPEGFWAAFAARARVIIYNKNLMRDLPPPKSIYDMLDPKYKGKVAIANPLFGTTATHTAALFVKLGKEKTEEYFAGLKKNEVAILPGNATVRDRVVEGQVLFGLTDTDDVSTAFAKNAPVEWVFPDQDTFGTLVIPNSVGLINKAPHPDAAKVFIDYLLSPKVEEMLAKSESVNIPVRNDVTPPDRVPDLKTLKLMELNYEAVADQLDSSAKFIQETFLK